VLERVVIVNIAEVGSSAQTLPLL